MSAASIAWTTDSVIASIREARPKVPADSPARTDSRVRAARMRHAWSAGYWPMRKSRRLSVTTSHRASVTAHPAT